MRTTQGAGTAAGWTDVERMSTAGQGQAQAKGCLIPVEKAKVEDIASLKTRSGPWPYGSFLAFYTELTLIIG